MREIMLTADGSHTVAIPEMNVTYHSHHGAVQESVHVFIEAGLKHLLKHSCNENISILEIGFGTGLNALLTAIEVQKSSTSVYYVAVEPFPLEMEEAQQLNYCNQLERPDLYSNFIRMHECAWNKSIVSSENMLVHKSKYALQEFSHPTKFNLIYYDAFAPSAQPELWTREVFQKLVAMLQLGGVLVTYCSKVEVRRAMQAAGFVVEKLPGPKGKREMLRATSPPAPLQHSCRGEEPPMMEEPLPKYVVRDKAQFENARQNRQESTEAEAKLWEQLRGSKLGCKFRRQHPVEGFIADFICLKKGLVVEVDGGYHDNPEQQLLDQQRTQALTEKGFIIVRFTNNEVMQNVYGVVNKLKQVLISL